MELRIGKVTHYYNRIGVAVLDVKGELNTGDTVHIRGANTDFTQEIASLEIDHQKVETVAPGSEVALKVNQRVRKGDLVYKVTE